jgi:photosystem II stability/assembly factor-like uncharacterized protein
VRLALLSLVTIASCGRGGFDALVDARAEQTDSPLAFTQESFASSPPMEVYDLLQLTPTSSIAVADQGLWRSPGDGTWTLDPFTPITLYGTIPLGNGEAYVVGNVDGANQPICARVTPTTAANEDTALDRALNDGWASSPTDIYIAGYNAYISHSTGDGTWTTQTSLQTDRFLSMWGSGPTDIYAVGDTGSIFHSTGNGVWTQQMSGSTEQLIEVTGDGPTNIYAVGYNGTILHSTGDGTWTTEDSGVTDRLLGVGAIDGVYYAVGRGPYVLRSNGDGVWTQYPIDVPLFQLDAVVADTRGGMWLSGEPGVILHSP